MPINHLSTSFKDAGRGIIYAWRHEQNFRLEVVVGVLVLLIGFWLKISASDWRWLAVLIGLVLVLELANTALEKVLDVVKPRLVESVKIVKDIMAGAVLVGSLAAAIIGLCILLPRIVELVSGW